VKLILWFGAGIMLTATAVILLITPIRSCPDCEGTGVGLVVFRDCPTTKCARCRGNSRISALRKWTTNPEPTFVGGIAVEDWPSVERLSKREQLGLSPGDGMLGRMDVMSESPQQARRARELIERDARERGYRFSPAYFTR
jgi:hypothetical protein